MMKKFYLIYKITNNVNQKFYIGKHKTNNIDDDYFGSGKILRLAIKKYGLENFTKTVLFYCANEEEMNLLEHYVVTPEFCRRDDVYNINEGGNGGWQFINTISDYKIGSKKRKRMAKKASKYAIKKLNDLGFTNAYSYHLSLVSDVDYIDECKKRSERVIKWHQQNPNQFTSENNPMFGHVYTMETFNKMSSSKRGEKNNRYGSKWYYDPVTFESHSFLPDEEIPNGWIRGRKIKKKN